MVETFYISATLQSTLFGWIQVSGIYRFHHIPSFPPVFGLDQGSHKTQSHHGHYAQYRYKCRRLGTHHTHTPAFLPCFRTGSMDANLHGVLLQATQKLIPRIYIRFISDFMFHFSLQRSPHQQSLHIFLPSRTILLDPSDDHPNTSRTWVISHPEIQTVQHYSILPSNVNIIGPCINTYVCTYILQSSPDIQYIL